MKKPEKKKDWKEIAKWSALAIVVIALVVMMIYSGSSGHGHEH